ncbi:MAG TPA: HWE histidine kinase domain-containing protein, partial [Xanthobacteraceae bacterium]|nr:HWE histidine kinase domain-containing protein [Xanthobacteraceae bacterium]
MAARIGNADCVQELLERIVTEVQLVTGFDRVMVYRFDESGDGHVAAERRRDPAAESLLGLRYPSSDIPAQARALYLKNWIRCIPDARYSPMPIVPETNPETGQPLDLTFSTLRSVAPIHLEYLANMGVRASMSLSMVVHGRLWGLIACHHREPHRLSYSLRSALELFAQLASLQLTTCLDLEYARRVAARRDRHHRIVESLAGQSFPASLSAKLDDLVQLVSADGVIVHADGETSSAGSVPSSRAIATLLAWLDGQPRVGLWHTDRLAEHAPIDGDDIAAASGLLAIAIPNGSRGYVLWFRRELVKTVTWAGDPRKAVAQSANRISPRASFAAWRELTRGRSQAWNGDEIEAANRLRTELLETELLRLQSAASRREVIGTRQDLVMAELDHRVKNTLATIQSVVRFSGKSAESLTDFVKALELRLVSMARAHDLLTSSRWTGASLQQLVRDELAAFRPAESDAVIIAGKDFLLKPSVALAMSLVFHELATNAAKHGALSTPQGSVVVTCESLVGEAGTPAARVEWRER